MDFPTELNQRAYSVFEVKSFDEDQRIIEGLASTPAMDRQGDIMESAGAEFSLPHPLLWQHRHDAPIGEVIHATHTKDGILIRAKIAAAGVLPEIDRAWALIKARLVKGFSIGWSPIDFAPLKGGRFHVKKWRWMETSTVTVPANQHATIALVKSLDTRSPAAPGTGPRLPATPPGASGILRTEHMATISEQIGEVKDDLQVKSARLDELMAQDGTEGGLNDDETKELDALTSGVEILTKKLGRLTIQEAAQAAQAKSIAYVPPQITPAARESKVEVKSLPKGTLFVRYAMAVAAGKGSLSDTLQYAKRWDSQTPEVTRYIKALAGTTDGGSPGWGAELLAQRVDGEFVELLMPATIIGRLNLRGAPFNTRLLVQTDGALVEWVGQVGRKPVGQLAFTELTLDHHKIAGIVVLSEELVRFSRPNAEETVRTDLTNQVTKFMDRQFIDISIGEGPDNPASITNSVTPISASGTDLDSLYIDINTALAGFDTAELGTDGVSIVTTPALARGISMLRTALGTRAEDGLTPNGGTLLGFPVVVSNNVTAGDIVFIKTNEVLLADDGRVTLDASNQATLDMGDGSPGSATFSLWQRNCVGIRAERFITWKKRREEAVAMISGAAYGPSVGSP